MLGDARQQLRLLLIELADQGLPAVSLATLRRLVKELGYSWKRMRRSLRAQRDPVLFATFQEEMALLRQAQTRGELDLVFADECRFSRDAPVPYAWQRRGQPPVELPAQRGGWSVLGLWHAHAPTQPLWSWRLPGALNAALFVAAVDEWSLTLSRPTVLVLDNASIHHALLVRDALPRWRQRGVQLQFLPAYSPELNAIEILWHHCKHYWITPADYQSEETLCLAIDRVLTRVGQDYCVNFA